MESSDSERSSGREARLAQWKSTSFTRKGPQVQVLQRAPLLIDGKWIAESSQQGEPEQVDLRDAEYANSTNNEILRKLLLPVLDTERRQEWITVNPVGEVKPLKKVEPDSRQPEWEMALQIVIEAARYSPESSELLQAMLLFGVGQAGIQTVQGQDFDFGRKAIHFKRVKTLRPFLSPSTRTKELIDGLRAACRLQVDQSSAHDGAHPRSGFQP